MVDTETTGGTGGESNGETVVSVGAGLALLGLSLLADGVAGGRIAERIGRARTVAVGGALTAVGVTAALAVTRSETDGEVSASPPSE
jgi:MFS family permease